MLPFTPFPSPRSTRKWLEWTFIGIFYTRVDLRSFYYIHAPLSLKPLPLLNRPFTYWICQFWIFDPNSLFFLPLTCLPSLQQTFLSKSFLSLLMCVVLLTFGSFSEGNLTLCQSTAIEHGLYFYFLLSSTSCSLSLTLPSTLSFIQFTSSTFYQKNKKNLLKKDLPQLFFLFPSFCLFNECGAENKNIDHIKTLNSINIWLKTFFFAMTHKSPTEENQIKIFEWKCQTHLHRLCFSLRPYHWQDIE